MKRQAMEVTIAQLKKVIAEAETETGGLHNEEQRFIIGIINKTPECSDTWRIE